jgi:hypothetical protein
MWEDCSQMGCKVGNFEIVVFLDTSIQLDFSWGNVSIHNAAQQESGESLTLI